MLYQRQGLSMRIAFYFQIVILSFIAFTSPRLLAAQIVRAANNLSEATSQDISDVAFNTTTMEIASETPPTVTLDTNTLNQISKFIESKKNNKLKFGISAGVRTFLASDVESKSRTRAIIAPDSTVQIISGDYLSFLISSSITYFPSNSDYWKYFGVTLNVNLAEFAKTTSSSVFNKAIDGGGGIAIAFDESKQCALAITYERIAVRNPTEWLFSHDKKKIVVNNVALTSIDQSSDMYYTDSGLNGFAIKLIFHF